MLKKFSTILSAAEQDTTSMCQPVTFAGLRHGTVYVSVRTLGICEAFAVFVGTQAVDLGLPAYVVRSRLSFGRISCARNQYLGRGHMVSISNASRRRPWNVDCNKHGKVSIPVILSQRVAIIGTRLRKPSTHRKKQYPASQNMTGMVNANLEQE